MKRIFFNNNQFSPLSESVQKVMQESIAKYANTLNSGYGNDYEQFTLIEEAKEVIAQTIKVAPHEICFSQEFEDAEKLIIDKSIILLGIKTVITSEFEEKEKLEYLTLLEKNGFIKLFFISSNQYGELDLEQLNDLLKESVGKVLISLSHANIYTGALLPIKNIIKSSQKYNSVFHLNAQLTFGRFNLNFEQNKPDIISFDTNLINGPKGVSCVIVNDKLPVNDKEFSSFFNILNNLSQNIFLVAGLKIAVENLNNEITADYTYISELKNYFSNQIEQKLGISSIDNHLKNKPLFNQLAFFISKKAFGEYLFEQLDLQGIQIPHLLYPCNKEDYFLNLALGKNNTIEEIDYFIKILSSIKNSNIA